MTRRRAARAATIHAVLGATSDLIEERGVEATTVRDIANAAQVSVGTVMSVGDKDALIVRVVDAMIEAEHRARRSAPPPHRAEGGCAERAFALIWPFAAMFAHRLELGRRYAAILVTGRHSSRVFTELAGHLVRELREVFEDCAHDAAVPTHERAQCLYRTYIGTLFAWAAAPEPRESELRAALRHSCALACPLPKESP
ncbi:MAG: TetR/AcrR family transcriptional regulator [Bowdeniella nasicola]|nr:TetR/AcrR family transcriptional regulator [Bowdeniella nasicola]